MDEQTSIAMRKLLKDSVAVSIPRYKYEVATLQEELDRLKKTRKVKVSKKVFSFFERGRNIPIETRIAALESQIAQLSSVMIEGVLTPITEAEIWECRHEYTAQRIFLRRQQLMKERLSSDASRAYDDALDMICNNVLLAKQVECMLKRKDKADGQYVRLFNYNEVSRFDARLLADLWLIYETEFILTADELKKSSAPQTKAS